MPRFFNTSGPCVPGKHYMLPPEHRVRGVQRLIDREEYFVIYAPRQSGKTTVLRSLEDTVSRDGTRATLYVTLEIAQGRTSREEAIPTIIEAIGKAAIRARLSHIDESHLSRASTVNPDLALREFLQDWCGRLSSPLVLLLDEVDCLTDDALISFLRQLRSGYIDRPLSPFPASIALVGMRNIRDYRANVRPDRETLGSASPSNIAAEALTLLNFTQEEVARLCGQHTEETGQVFLPEALARCHQLTDGQPWLVNALFRHCVDELAPEPTIAVGAKHLEIKRLAN